MTKAARRSGRMWAKVVILGVGLIVAPPLAITLVDAISSEQVAGAFQSGPTRGTGSWVIETSTDPIDDSRTVRISVAAATVDGTLVNPTLVARCQDERTSAYIYWGTYVGADANFPDSPYRDVTVRVDEFPSDVATAILSSDKTATFFGSSEVFLQRLFDREKLTVRITPYRSGPVTAQFDVAGLRQASAALREACGWAEATFIEGRVEVGGSPISWGMIKHIGSGSKTSFSPNISGAEQMIRSCSERICYIKGRVVDRQLVEIFAVTAE